VRPATAWREGLRSGSVDRECRHVHCATSRVRDWVDRAFELEVRQRAAQLAWGSRAGNRAARASEDQRRRHEVLRVDDSVSDDAQRSTREHDRDGTVLGERRFEFDFDVRMRFRRGDRSHLRRRSIAAPRCRADHDVRKARDRYALRTEVRRGCARSVLGVGRCVCIAPRLTAGVRRLAKRGRRRSVGSAVRRARDLACDEDDRQRELGTHGRSSSTRRAVAQTGRERHDSVGPRARTIR